MSYALNGRFVHTDTMQARREGGLSILQAPSAVMEKRGEAAAPPSPPPPPLRARDASIKPAARGAVASAARGRTVPVDRTTHLEDHPATASATPPPTLSETVNGLIEVCGGVDG